MPDSRFVSPDTLRATFSAAMSTMYRNGVPACGTLIKLVEAVTEETLNADQRLAERLGATDSRNRISQERHGAIRLGTPDELDIVSECVVNLERLPRQRTTALPLPVPLKAVSALLLKTDHICGSARSAFEGMSGNAIRAALASRGFEHKLRDLVVSVAVDGFGGSFGAKHGIGRKNSNIMT